MNCSSTRSLIPSNDSQIYAQTAGLTNTEIVLISAMDNSAIHLTHDTLTVSNQMTLANGGSVPNIGVGARDSSTVYLNNVKFALAGGAIQNTKTLGNGQIIWE